MGGGATLLDGGLLEQLPVDLLLSLSDAYVDVHFYLRKKGLFDFPFDTSEHERPEDLVELLDDLVVLLLDLLLTHAFGALQVEPLIEVV